MTAKEQCCNSLRYNLVPARQKFDVLSGDLIGDWLGLLRNYPSLLISSRAGPFIVPWSAAVAKGRSRQSIRAEAASH